MLGIPIFAGLAAAVIHVVSGPDHLAAVTPLALESRTKVWRIGLFWGAGHLIGMLFIGLLYLLFKTYLPLESISRYSEQLVGFVLVAVGLWALSGLFLKRKTHEHPHIHGGPEPYIHVHEHEHDQSTLNHTHSHRGTVRQSLWSSFGIGLLHGLAGIAHFILLLPVLGFENRGESLQYILGFAFGTVGAMMVYTFLLGTIARVTQEKTKPSLFLTLRLSGGLFAIAVGIYWMYIGF